MTLLGRPMPDCGPGLMFADHEADILRGHALERDMRAPDRVGVALLVGIPLCCCRDRRHALDQGSQFMLYEKTRLSIAALGQRTGFRVGQRRALPHEE